MSNGKTMKVLDYIEFGKIIRKWSNGTEQPPATIKEFRAQVPNNVVEIGTGYDNTDEIHYAVLPPSSAQVSFIIPHKEDIDINLPTNTWPLPDFYSDLAFNNTPVNVVTADKEKFKSCRIADYSSTKCM